MRAEIKRQPSPKNSQWVMHRRWQRRESWLPRAESEQGFLQAEETVTPVLARVGHNRFLRSLPSPRRRRTGWRAGRSCGFFRFGQSAVSADRQKPALFHEICIVKDRWQKIPSRRVPIPSDPAVGNRFAEEIDPMQLSCETCCLLNGLQAQEKRGTMAGLAFAPDRPVHFIGQFLGQGQPVTG